MAYKVVKVFRDLQDGDFVYRIGDVYPREGKKATKKRIAELAGVENVLGYAVIEEEVEDVEDVEDVEEPAIDEEADAKAE